MKYRLFLSLILLIVFILDLFIIGLFIEPIITPVFVDIFLLALGGAMTVFVGFYAYYGFTEQKSISEHIPNKQEFTPISIVRCKKCRNFYSYTGDNDSVCIFCDSNKTEIDSVYIYNTP